MLPTHPTRAPGDPDPSPYDRITRMLHDAIGVPYVAFAGFDLERHFFCSQQGLNESDANSCVPLCATVMFSTEPVVIADLAQDERYAVLPVVARAPGLRAYAGVGVRNPQSLSIGALWMADHRLRDFSLSDLRLLVDCAQLIERELLMAAMARNDALTGLYNSSHCEAEVELELRRARRERQQLTVLLIDVDRMADFNETYGYTAGDDALRRIAEVLLATFRRAGDRLMRQAGDRILALLPETAPEHALRLADYARLEIEACGIGNPAADSRLTVSVGMASAGAGGEYPAAVEVLLNRAANALAAAKSAGRNRAAGSELPCDQDARGS